MSDHSCTTTQAAELVGVSPVTIRRWVMKGWLHPLHRGTRPLRFWTSDVQLTHRLHAGQHARLDTLWSQVLASEDPEQER